MSDMSGRKVKGHICPGLARFQSRIDYNNEPDENRICIPIFDKFGCVVGCDDTNHAAITHCPFCGIELATDDIR